jgi:superfamily II DNA or RNA helicase
MAIVRAHVDGALWLEGAYLSTKSYERIVQGLSFTNPRHRMLTAWKRDTSGIPEMIQAAVELPDGLRVPRGAIGIVRKLLQKDGHELKIVGDARSAGDSIEIPKAEALLSKLRSYQLACVDAIEQKTQGLVVLSCGAGKSFAGLGAVARLRRSTLILVHTTDLLNQWIESLRKELGVEAGKVAAGKADWKPVTVALEDSLISQTDGLLVPDEWKRFGLLIHDEVHHSPSATHQKLLPLIPAKYRLGLTATPDREDGCEPLMHWSFGPILLEKTADELIREGWLMRPDLELVESRFRFESNASMFRKSQALMKALVADEERNRLIAGIAVRDALAGETVAVLSNHREHCRLLGRLCWELGFEAEVLIADATKAGRERRARILSDLQSGKRKLVIATSLLDEGVSIDRLSRIVLALPAKAKGPTEQRLGRLMRLFQDKKPKLYDVIDRQVDTLVRRWEGRRRAYVKIGLVRAGGRA